MTPREARNLALYEITLALSEKNDVAR